MGSATYLSCSKRYILLAHLAQEEGVAEQIIWCTKWQNWIKTWKLWHIRLFPVDRSVLNWRRRDQSWTARQTGLRKNWPNWRTGGLCQIINPNSCDITQCRTAVVSEFMGSGYDGRFVARCGVRATQSRVQSLNSPASLWAARTANQPSTPPRTVSQPPTKYPSSGLAFHNSSQLRIHDVRQRYQL